MQRPVTPVLGSLKRIDGIDPGEIPNAADLGLDGDPCPGRQPGGRSGALASLSSFLETRGAAYHKEISSPLTASESCSRLSAHLAAGSLSMREAAQATWRRLPDWDRLPGPNRRPPVGCPNRPGAVLRDSPRRGLQRRGG